MSKSIFQFAFLTTALIVAPSAQADFFKEIEKRPLLTTVIVGTLAAGIIAGNNRAHDERELKKDRARQAEAEAREQTALAREQEEDSPKMQKLREKSLFINNENETKVLRRNMAVNGDEAASGCIAQHIISNMQPEAMEVLTSCNIGFDDAANGVYMPLNKSATCKGASYHSINGQLYGRTVTSLLLGAKENGCSQVASQLAEIKQSLR